MEQLITQQDLGLSQNTLSGRVTARLMMSLLGLNKLNRFCEPLLELTGVPFAKAVLDKLNAKVEVLDKRISHRPLKGGFLMVANTPHGVFDLLAVMTTVVEQYPNTLFMINTRLADIPQFRDYVLGFDQEPAIAVTRRAVNHLREGGVVIAFPSDGVSEYTRLLREVADPQWNPSILKLAKFADVPIIPLFIEGENSRKFLLLSRMNTALGQLRLPAELLNKSDYMCRLVFGEPIMYSDAGHDAHEVAMFVRALCYLLSVQLDSDQRQDAGTAVVREVNWVTADLAKLNEAAAVAVEKGVRTFDENRTQGYIVNSQELIAIGFYDKVAEGGYYGKYRNEFFVLSDNKILFAASLVCPNGDTGEAAYSCFESHHYFEFVNKKVDALIGDCVEISNIYYDRNIVSGGDLIATMLTSVGAYFNVHHVVGNVLFAAPLHSLGFAILVRFIRARMFTRRFSRLIIPRNGMGSIKTGRFVTGQVRGVKRIELIMKLISDVQGQQFSLSPLINDMFVNGANVVSLGTSIRTDSLQARALIALSLKNLKRDNTPK